MKKIYSSLALLFFGLGVNAQTLTLQDAIGISLQNNHGIQVRKLQNEATQKDVHVGKTGLLPKVDAVAGGNYSNNTSDVTFAGNIPSIIGANAILKGYNAAVQLSYTLFDGLGTFNSYQKLKNLGELSDIQSKISIESTLLQMIANYFDVVRNVQLTKVYEATLAISKERLAKANDNYAYGAAAKIDVLNAKVDYNSDFSNYTSQVQNLQNAKRQLNFLLGRELSTAIDVEEDYEIKVPAAVDSLKGKVLENNSSILLSQLNVSAAEIDKKIISSRFTPKIAMNLSYGTNYSENSASIMLKSSSLGFTGALSLSWNLFNGFSDKKELEKAKLLIEASEEKKAEAELNLEKEFLELYDALQLNITLIQIEEESIEAASLNLERSKELYYNGTLNNLQFRQAQINLLIAENKLNNLKFQAKLQEFQLKRLTNELIN